MNESPTIIAYLGLGSNLGDRRGHLAGARAALSETGLVRPCGASPLYLAEAVGGPPGQPDFFNAVLRVETSCSPRQLLESCQTIEGCFGRKRNEMWGPRTLDIDLLFFGDRICREAGLEIPHPRLHERRFVLAPLRDLAPELVHPLLQMKIDRLYESLRNSQSVRRLAGTW